MRRDLIDNNNKYLYKKIQKKFMDTINRFLYIWRIIYKLSALSSYYFKYGYIWMDSSWPTVGR